MMRAATRSFLFAMLLSFAATCARADAPWLKTIVPAGADWKYLDTGTDQETSWRVPAFNDTGWPTAPAQFGYGDDDEATVIDYGPFPTLKYPTTYFRHRFEATNLTGICGFVLRLLRDDGAVVYLNGSERVRQNMPGGQILYSTFASSEIPDGPAENTYYTANLAAATVVEGTNLLAVEVHVFRRNTPDLSFDLELLSKNYPPPRSSFQAAATVNRFATANPMTNLQGAAVSNVAGCCPGPGTNELLVLTSDPEAIHVYDLNGNRLRSITLSEFDDTEGICEYDAANHLYAVVEEGSNDISIVAIDAGTTFIAKSSNTIALVSMGLVFGDPDNGIEGVTYNPREDCWYAVKETLPMRVYRVIGTGAATTVTDLFNAEQALSNLCSDLSDIFYDPYRDRLFVLSDESNRVVECDLAGQVIASFALDGAAARGFTFLSNGMYAATVGSSNEYRRYSLAPPEGASGPGTTVQLPVVLSWTVTNRVTVDYVVTSETAVAGVDYSPAAGQLVFNPGSQSALLGLSLLTNSPVSINKVIDIVLTNVASAVLGNDAVYTWYIPTNRYELNVISEHDNPSPPVGIHIYNHATPVTCSVTQPTLYDGVLATQYVCVGWLGGGSIPWIGFTPNAGSRLIVSDSWIRWTWQTNFWLATDASGCGSVLYGNRWRPRDQAASVEAVALENHRFAGWSGDTGAADTNDPVLTVTMDRPRSVTAHFAVNLATNGLPVEPYVQFSTSTMIDRFQLDFFTTNLPGSYDHDMSSCCYVPTRNELFALLRTSGANNYGIQVYDTDGNYLRLINLLGFYDLEGICIYNEESNLFAVVEEGTNDITILTITPATVSVNKSEGEVIRMGLPFGPGYNSGIEGISYDAPNDRFYAVKEYGLMAVYSVRTNGAGVSVAEIFDAEETFSGHCTDLSDLVYDPVSGRLFILSDNEKLVFECDLSGNILASLPVPSEQPEGISFSGDLGVMYIISEPNHYYRYVLQPLSLTAAEGATVNIELRLSWAVTNEVAVDFVVAGVTATAGIDFAPATGTVVFAPGAVVQTATVSVIVDPGWESEELFQVVLTNAAYARLGRDISYDCSIPANTVLVFQVVSAHGGAVPGIGTNLVDYGNSIECMVTNSPVAEGLLATQYVCWGWSGNGSVPISGTGTNTGLFPITNDSQILWRWRTECYLAVTTNGYGSITGGNRWVTATTNAALEAIPDSFYHFRKWSGDIDAADTNVNPVTMDMDRPRTVTGWFAENLATNRTPEWWLALHYPEGTNDFDAAATNDTDHDGLAPWAEYKAGTDPTNRLSVLRIMDIGRNAATNMLTWQSVSNRVYAVQYSTNLLDGWEPMLLQSGITGAVSGVSIFEDPSGGNNVRFYRIRLE